MDIREKYQTFYYNSFNVEDNLEGLVVTYNYSFAEYEFNPHVTIKKECISNDHIDDNFLQVLFFYFGIINAINYYKLICSKNFVIKCGYLDDKQKTFFKKLFYNGLGELLYRNNLKISFADFMNITSEGKKIKFDNPEAIFKGNLIPIGGGKDSIVTLELLKEEKANNMCLLYQRNIYPEDEASKKAIFKAGYTDENIARFNLTLDPLMLDLNKKGFYNGHIPFSSCLAFASFIVAYLTKKKYIVLSNEASANEGNVKGMEVNHQYSKSFEFEKDFRQFTSTYLTPYIEYFSLLRPWNEYRIIKEFLKHEKYLPIFRSCNVGSKQNKWCGSCAKCLYVTIMLYPFVSKEKIEHIFGCDMLDDIKYKDLLLGLISDSYDKPFECVGTKEEVNYALSLALQKENLPILLNYYRDNYYDVNRKYNVEDYFNKDHFVPNKFLKMMGYDTNEK